ncbi:Ig-like domain-containing protein, partial [Pantoea sp.]|uniref:Ig-like domain-containing protein n=1 Tax=Pantoea sp. TaxID=69393 RepID=UPI0031DBCCAC
TATVAADRSWSITVSPALAQGEQTLTATFDDGVHQTQSNPWVVNIDTVAPAVGTITEIWDNVGTTGAVGRGEVTDDNTPTVRGSGEALSWVYIYDGLTGTTVLGSTQVRADGTWEVELNPLADGTYNFTAHFVDRAGNPSAGRAESWPVTIDTIPPTGTITGADNDIDPINLIPISNGGLTNDATPVIRGTGEIGAQVILTNLFGVELGRGIVGGDGSWSIIVNPALSEGNTTITAHFFDGANEAVSNPWTIVVDTVAPPVGTITEIWDNVGTTGAVGSGEKTDDNTPTLRGSGEALSWVYIYDGLTGTTLLGSVQVPASGNWELELPALADGTYNFTAEFVDLAGNVSAGRAQSWPITIDTVPPVGAITGASNDIDPANLLPISNGGLTNDATPVIRGTGEEGDIVTLHDQSGTPRGSAVVATDGTWSIIVTPALGEGAHTLTATFDDGVNQSVSAPWVINVDTIVPDGEITSATNDNDPLNPISVANGGATNDTTPVIRGTGEVGAQVVLRDQNDVVRGTATVAGDGSWSITITPALAEGDYTLIAHFDDGANKAVSDPWVVIVDTTPPTGSITEIVDDFAGTPGYGSTGLIGVDGRTDDNTPTMRGTTEANAWVYIYATDGGAVIGSTQANDLGAWALTLPTQRDGTYSYKAVFVDAAGNRSPVVDSWNITIDTTPPAVGRITGLYDNAGSSTGFHSTGSGRITTDDTTPEIRGTGAQVGDLVILWNGSTAVGSVRVTASDGSWSITPSLSMNNSYDLTATFQDDLGNRSGHTSPVQIRIQADAPLFTSGYENFESVSWGQVSGTVTYASGLTITGNSVNHGGFVTGVRSSREGTAHPANSGNAGFYIAEHSFISMRFGTGTNKVSFDYSYTSASHRVDFYDTRGTLLGSQWMNITQGSSFASTGVGTISFTAPAGSLIGYVRMNIGEEPLSTGPGEPIWGGDGGIMIDNIRWGTLARSAFLLEPATSIVEEESELATLAAIGSTDGMIILDGVNQEINLGSIIADDQILEVIDITGSGDNTLTLSLGDILTHGEKDLFVADGTVQMMIKGDEGDVVNLDDLINGSDPGDWAKASDMVEVAGVRYQVFTHSTHDAELLVQEGVQTNLI